MRWDALYNLFSETLFSNFSMFPDHYSFPEYELFLECLTGVTLSLYVLIPLIAVYFLIRFIIRCFLWE